MTSKRSFGAVLAGGYLRLRGLFPLKYHRFWARILAWLLQHVLHYRVGVVKTNLARSFPEKQYEELDTIQNKFYRHFANIFTEMVWYSACRGKWGRKRLHKSHIVEFANPEEFNRLVNAAPQMMLLLSHTGNWELISGAFYYSYGEPLDFTPPMVTVAHYGIRSKVWDQVMEESRTAPIRDLDFHGYVHTDGILRHALTHKGEKKVYIFITDQYPYVRNGSLTVDFMHQLTRTMTGAAALACKLNMSVGYIRYRCREDGGYTMSVVPLSDNASADNPDDIMKRYYKLLEEDLQAQPWNYLWTHKRWKQVV